MHRCNISSVFCSHPPTSRNFLLRFLRFLAASVFAVGLCAVFAVAAGKIAYNAVALHHKDVVGYGIKEKTVVADHNHATFEIREIFFENAECYYVEVVTARGLFRQW